MSGILPDLPIRCILAAPSGGGKGILVSDLLLNRYRGKFERIYYFSASALLDDNLKPIQNESKNIKERYHKKC